MKKKTLYILKHTLSNRTKYIFNCLLIYLKNVYLSIFPHIFFVVIFHMNQHCSCYNEKAYTATTHTYLYIKTDWYLLYIFFLLLLSKCEEKIILSLRQYSKFSLFSASIEPFGTFSFNSPLTSDGR